MRGAFFFFYFVLPPAHLPPRRRRGLLFFACNSRAAVWEGRKRGASLLSIRPKGWWTGEEKNKEGKKERREIPALLGSGRRGKRRRRMKGENGGRRRTFRPFLFSLFLLCDQLSPAPPKRQRGTKAGIALLPLPSPLSSSVCAALLTSLLLLLFCLFIVVGKGRGKRHFKEDSLPCFWFRRRPARIGGGGLNLWLEGRTGGKRS